jgi:four helix bundle protein
LKKNPILKHSIDFSLATINYCETLDAAKKYIISKQLFRSATSIGANSMEAQNAESRADFIHKIKIAAKEADETQYWLTLCTYAKDYPSCDELSSRLVEIQRLLNSILYTSKRKIQLVIF